MKLTLALLLVCVHAAFAAVGPVHDSAAAAAEGAVPLAVLLAPAGYQFSWSWTAGRLFANGIYVCNSSTDVTKTIGSADCLFDINYRG